MQSTTTESTAADEEHASAIGVLESSLAEGQTQLQSATIESTAADEKTGTLSSTKAFVLIVQPTSELVGNFATTDLCFVWQFATDGDDVWDPDVGGVAAVAGHGTHVDKNNAILWRGLHY